MGTDNLEMKGGVGAERLKLSESEEKILSKLEKWYGRRRIYLVLLLIMLVITISMACFSAHIAHRAFERSGFSFFAPKSILEAHPDAPSCVWYITGLRLSFNAFAFAIMAELFFFALFFIRRNSLPINRLALKLASRLRELGEL